MKVGKNKLLQKILLVTLTTLIVFNFIMPTVVRADDDEDIGGGLFTPIQSLLVGLGDSIMRLMQIAFTGSDSVTTTIKYSDDAMEIKEKAWWLTEEFDWQNQVEWEIINEKTKKAKIKVPTIEISPESIFSGKIPAFDINFFSPQDSKSYENYHYEENASKLIYISEIRNTGVTDPYFVTGDYKETVHGASYDTGIDYGNKSFEEILIDYGWTIDDTLAQNDENRYSHTSTNSVDKSSDGFTTTFEWEGEDTENVSEIRYKLIVTHKYATAGERYNSVIAKLYEKSISKVVESEGEKHSTAGQLRETVSYWYNILRNIAIIGLLSVLVYIGIRIVLSSAASDKSKYKEMLKDWLVAICLLFFMHYFMNFTVTIIDSISSALIQEGTLVVKENGVTTSGYTEETTNIPFVGDRLIGEVRIRLQTGDASQRMAYTIIYIVLIVYTFIFALMYLKRVLYIAFFTMMAPLVALMYPIDKVRDGKAQAFDMWMKEYTFNALIQPFHLIIYYVLVSSAIDLASENPIYALVAIGFMIPAEKLLRKFFGFNKSETSGFLGGALGGAMLMQGINALSKKGKSSGGKKGGSGGGESKEEAKKPVRTADSGKNMNELLDSIDAEKEGPTLNPSNGIPTGDSNYSAGRERLEELEAEGFGAGDPEWEQAKADFDKYNLNNQLEEDLGGDSAIGVSDFDSDGDYSDDNGVGADTEFIDESEKTHRFKAGATMAGRWALKAGGLALRAGTAATLGTIGVAAGLASDDYSNVVKWGAAGAVAGNAVAGAGMNKVKGLPSDAYRVKQAAENERRRYEEMAYSAQERKRRANERADDAFMKDKQVIQLYKDKFQDKYKERMEQAKKYREYGITDNDAIIRAMKLDTKGLPTDKADKRRILIAGTASKLGRKDVDQFGERLMSRGYTKEAAETMKKAVREFNDFE